MHKALPIRLHQAVQLYRSPFHVHSTSWESTSQLLVRCCRWGATINMDGTAILSRTRCFVRGSGKRRKSGHVTIFHGGHDSDISFNRRRRNFHRQVLLLAATVLGVVGVESEEALLVIAFIFPFDRLLDMMRTVTNVSGDLAVACAVAKWEDSLDEGIFRGDAELPRKGE